MCERITRASVVKTQSAEEFFSPCRRRGSPLYRCRSLEWARSYAEFIRGPARAFTTAYPFMYIFRVYGKRIKSPIKSRRYIENSASGIYIYVCMYTCIVRQGCLYAVHATEVWALIKPTCIKRYLNVPWTRRSSILRAIRDASVGRHSFVLTTIILSTAKSTYDAYRAMYTIRVKTIINTCAILRHTYCGILSHLYYSFATGWWKTKKGKSFPAVSSIFLYLVETNCQLH